MAVENTWCALDALWVFKTWPLDCNVQANQVRKATAWAYSALCLQNDASNSSKRSQQHLKGHNMNIRDLGVEKSNYNEDRNDLENGKIVIPKETRVESEKFRKPISVWYNATSIQSSTSPVLLVHRRNGDGCLFPKDWEINGKIPAIIYVLPARNCNRWELLVQIQRKSY